jgi:hypothetical protein
VQVAFEKAIRPFSCAEKLGGASWNYFDYVGRAYVGARVYVEVEKSSAEKGLMNWRSKIEIGLKNVAIIVAALISI